MKFERKYRLEHSRLSEVLAIVNNHPFEFSSAYPDRWLNNIYLDTSDLQSLRDHLNGVTNRVTFRIRWYGKDMLNAKHPVLESKISVGDPMGSELSEKISRSLPSFTIESKQFITDYVRDNISAPLDLEPVLLNHYLRSYFISADGNFKLTIDREIEYHGIIPGFFSLLNLEVDPGIVMEVNYDEQQNEDWSMQSRTLPLELSRHSKYVHGMMLTGRGL